MPRKSSAQLEREIAESLAATSGAGFGDRKRLAAVSRATQHEKRKDIEARFPIGTHVKGTRKAFTLEGAIGKVTGYDLGMDEDEPQVRVRFLAPVKYMGRDLRVATFNDDAIVAITRDQLAANKLLARFKALDEKRVQAASELREAARESDSVDIADENKAPVDPARRKAVAKRLPKAIRAERAITMKMRDLVIKIRALDPVSVPWGWQNTR